MAFIEIFAGVGLVAEDVLALMGLVGCIMIYLFGRRARQFIEWGVMGVVFGWMFLLCMALTGPLPERIGMVIGLPPLVIVALLAVSTLLLGAKALSDRKHHSS